MKTKRRQARSTVKNEMIRVRLTAQEKEAWTKAATKDGRDLSGWLRWLANQAAGLKSSV